MSSGLNKSFDSIGLPDFLTDTVASDTYNQAQSNSTNNFLNIINFARSGQKGAGSAYDTYDGDLGIPDMRDCASLDSNQDGGSKVINYLLSGGASNLNNTQCPLCATVGGGCNCGMSGGAAGAGEDRYRTKYLKYKLKYLNMKKNM